MDKKIKKGNLGWKSGSNGANKRLIRLRFHTVETDLRRLAARKGRRSKLLRNALRTA